MRNPKWERDEIILALNLYFKLEKGSMSSDNIEVISLSEILNKLPIHTTKSNNDKFRNPNGVSFKLANFKSIDPEYKGKGSSSHSKLDKEVFYEYYQKKEVLKRIAENITLALGDDQRVHEISSIEDEIDDEILVKEGKVLYKLHKVRERNKGVVKRKKDEYLKLNGKLDCEVCGFDFYKTYGELGYGFIEAHHKTPLSKLGSATITKPTDLALVCSNCHRMLHRKISETSISELKSKLNRT